MRFNIRFFGIVIASFFTAELAIMHLFHGMEPGIPPQWLPLLDAISLSVVASIPTYFLYHRPIVKACKDLEQSEKNRRAFLDNAVEGIFGVDKCGKFTFANKACLRLLGYQAESQLLGKNMHAVIHYKRSDGTPYPEDECKIHNSYLRKAGVHLYDEILWRSDGTSFPVEYWSHPLEESGDATVFIVSFTDITARKHAEEQTKLSLSRLEALAELNHMREEPLQKILDFAMEKGVALTRSKIGLIGFVSSNGASFAVSSFSQSVMKECELQQGAYDLPIENSGLWAEAIRQLKPIIINDYPSIQHPNKEGYPEGHVKLSRFMSVPGIDGGKAVALITVGNKEEDYTDIDTHQLQLFLDGVWNIVKRRRIEESLKKSREMLLRSEKLASLGELAAGVAHEIKNPLNIISTSVQMLMMEDNIPKETIAEYQEILRQIARTVKITDNLRYFARKREPEIKQIDLHDFVEKTVALVEYEMKSDGIGITRKFQQAPIFMNADEDQLAQVFLNIINNARYSMNEKRTLHSWDELRNMGWTGKLTIETSVVNGKVVIIFEDTGMGISEENRSHIFVPFFTTKPEGKGTGLGLSVAYGIMENHGGSINIEGEEGKGAKVNLVFPLAEAGYTA